MEQNRESLSCTREKSLPNPTNTVKNLMSAELNSIHKLKKPPEFNEYYMAVT
jgi:hypothetical protein